MFLVGGTSTSRTIAAHPELVSRLGYRVSEQVELFLSGRNLLHAMDIGKTQANWGRISEHDVGVQARALEFNALNMDEMLEVNRRFWYGPPTEDTLGRMYRLLDGFLAHQGLPISGAAMMNMTGFEVLDLLFESDEVKATINEVRTP